MKGFSRQSRSKILYGCFKNGEHSLFMTLIFLFSEPFEVCGYFKCNAVKWSEKLFCSCTAVAWCYAVVLHFEFRRYNFVQMCSILNFRWTKVQIHTKNLPARSLANILWKIYCYKCKQRYIFCQKCGLVANWF